MLKWESIDGESHRCCKTKDQSEAHFDRCRSADFVGKLWGRCEIGGRYSRGKGLFTICSGEPLHAGLLSYIWNRPGSSLQPPWNGSAARSANKILLFGHALLSG